MLPNRQDSKAELHKAGLKIFLEAFTDRLG